MATIGFKPDDDVLILLGETQGALGQSLYQEHATGAFDGAPPRLIWRPKSVLAIWSARLIRDGVTKTVHDVSDGGVLAAAAEMALAGRRGVALEASTTDIPAHAFWFGEDQARYLVAVSENAAHTVRTEAENADVPARLIGRINGDAISLPGETPLIVAEFAHLHESWFPSRFAKN